MENLDTNSTRHLRPQPERPPRNPSGVSASQRQRVKEWIRNTEDNMTSSGVSDIEESVSNTQQDNPTATAPQNADGILGSSILSSESWDRFQVVSRDEQWGEEGIVTFLRYFKVVWIFCLLIVVLVAGVANKLALLTMTSAIVTGTEESFAAGDDVQGTEESFAAGDPRPNMLLVVLCFPYVCHLVTYTARSLFGGSHWPSLGMAIVVLLLEVSHTAGMCLLLFRVLPQVDLLRALVLMTLVYVMPSFLNVITTATSRMTSTGKRAVITCVAVATFLLQLGGAGLATYQGFRYNSTEAQRLQDDAARTSDEGRSVERSLPVAGQELDVQLPLALILVSLGFWENFIDGEFKLCGRMLSVSKWKARLTLVRQRLYIIVSVFKISASIVLAVLLVPNFTFTLTFPSNDLATTLTQNSNSSGSGSVVDHLEMYGPLYAMLVSAMLCSYASGLACKLCMQLVSFALPLSLVTPISAVIVLVECQYGFFRISAPTYTWVCPASLDGVTSWTSYHVFMLAVTWLSQCLMTWHVWRPTSGRMEKIQKLFITPMRCGVLTEQTLMVRRRIQYNNCFQGPDSDGTLFSDDVTGRTESTPLIYACATMWHETRKEMVQLMKSIFRMDIDRSARFIAQKYYNVSDPEYYDFEAHIFFDDAMELTEDGRHLPNSFVTTFMECGNDAISAVHERPTSLGDPVRTPTPYGGRLTWVLPGGTPLVVHLKDKYKIRHKKRWSQVMYMYYLLGYKILAGSDTTDQEPEFDSVSGILKKSESAGNLAHARLSPSELRRRRTAAHFTRSVIFSYVPEEVHRQAENTYILALDGDVDFKPEAVRLLLDRMKKNKKVGAACGRIHPIGIGPLVWYQKFEYAIGHWLQKATEHVFGCVLCAPGCFSLFRGSALMDDNVTRTYATRSTQAGHYVQYDQGEDRWLSTLLLQQGYRIDYSAAADALTHVPETFSEFFNQRRRWGPSTLANLIDLIGEWKSAVRLNDNLSTIYIFYQCMMLVSTVLGPATILLLMAGSFKVVFKITVVQSYTLTLAVPAIYLAICLLAKPRVQLTSGAALSAFYALVMTIVLVGTVGTAVLGSIASPNVLFLFTVIVVFIVSGLMHPQELYCVLPGILYLIMIPAGYLVLTIYFLTNLHVVSWGTRETHHQAGASPAQKVTQDNAAGSSIQRVLARLGLYSAVKEVGTLVFRNKNKGKRRNEKACRASGPDSAASRTEQLLEDLIVELQRDRVERGFARRNRTDDPLNASNDQGHPRSFQPSPFHHDDDAPGEHELFALQDEESQYRHPNHSLASGRRQRSVSDHDLGPMPHQSHYGSRSVRSRRLFASDGRLNSAEFLQEGEEDLVMAAHDSSNHRPVSRTQNHEQAEEEEWKEPTQQIHSDELIPKQRQQHPRHDDVMNPSWLTSDACGGGPVTTLNERERAFWSQLIHRYLYPLVDNKVHTDKMNADLRRLRNNVVFGFVMTSSIWIAITMQLEVLQNDLQSYLFFHVSRPNRGPPLHFQPLGMFFLASFAFILITQFIGMFAHRWGTLLHTLAITEIGLGIGDDEKKKVRDAIVRVIELQKLRNIELEPEPDYEEPLPDYNNPVLDNPIYDADNPDNQSELPSHGADRRWQDHMDDALSLASGFHPAGSQHVAGPAPPGHSHYGPQQSRHSELIGSPSQPFQVGRRRDFWDFDVGRGGNGPLGNFTLQRAFERRFRNELGSRPRVAGSQGGYDVFEDPRSPSRAELVQMHDV